MLVRKIIVSHVNAKDFYFGTFCFYERWEMEHAYGSALSGGSQFEELWKKQQAYPFNGGGRWCGDASDCRSRAHLPWCLKLRHFAIFLAWQRDGSLKVRQMTTAA
jgi:hypothetical protein